MNETMCDILKKNGTVITMNPGRGIKETDESLVSPIAVLVHRSTIYI